MACLSHIPTFHFPLFSNKLFSPYFAPLKLHHQKISSCSVKKPRASRKVKSNAELCNDIREFLSVVGLPEDHVPSLKELSQHGRQDLANIVRRRGYKVIREIIATSAGTSMNMFDREEGLNGKQEAVHDRENKSTAQDEEKIDLSDDISLSSNAASIGQGISGTEVGRQLNSDDQSCISPEASLYSSLQEKTNTGFGIISGRSSEDTKYIESQNALEPEYGSTSRELKDLVVCSADGAEISSENNLSSSQQVEDLLVENTASRNGCLSTESFIIDDCNEDLDVETQKVEDQADIDHLKFMLHQKELELMHLKQAIEKENLALAALQRKAEKEISKAQKLISEKDAELHAAEESLSGLKEVEIQYCGDGETVEVSGSFNGWHHRIKMDPIQSSSISDSTGPRKSRLWRTALWLYPGVYEIKFIVDGHWKIDPQRESVTSGSMHNNILRVDR